MSVTWTLSLQLWFSPLYDFTFNWKTPAHQTFTTREKAKARAQRFSRQNMEISRRLFLGAGFLFQSFLSGKVLSEEETAIDVLLFRDTSLLNNDKEKEKEKERERADEEDLSPLSPSLSPSPRSFSFSPETADCKSIPISSRAHLEGECACESRSWARGALRWIQTLRNEETTSKRQRKG